MLGSRRQPIEPLGLPPQLQAGFDGQMRSFSSTDIFPHSVVPVPEIAHTSADWLRVSEQSQILPRAREGRFGYVVVGIPPIHSPPQEMEGYETELPVGMASPRGPLSGPILFVVNLIDAWQLDRKEVIALLGFESGDLLHVDDLLNGRAPLKGRDAKDRIAHLFEIRRTLSALFRSLDVENAWLRESHYLLDDLVPMNLLLEGSMENLLLVKEYVLTAAGR